MTARPDRATRAAKRWWGTLALLAALPACGLLAPDADEVPREPWSDLACRAIAVPPGPEDLAIDHGTGIAYVASTDRWAVAGKTEVEGPIGHLSTLDLRARAPVAVDVTPAALRDRVFQPQGVGLHADATGTRLFVVNRRPARDPETGEWDTCDLDNAIEVLAAGPGGLRHLETITDAEALIRPNDVAPLAPDAFYVTNDHGARSCLGRNLRDLFGMNRGHLLYHDGTAFEVAARDLPFANGVAVDPGRRRVHVAASQTGMVHTYRHAPDAPSELRAAGPPVRLGSAPDNLTVQPDGGLLVAAHPDRFDFLFYARRWFGAERAPSQIVAIARPGSDRPGALEVFRDDGIRFPAASVAATYHWEEKGLERLLLGTVFADRVLLCDRPVPGAGAG